MSSIIRISDVRIGVDKLEHIFYSGKRYFEKWRSTNRSTIEEILIKGIKKEKYLREGEQRNTNIFSYADLTANFNGLLFWNDLLSKKINLLGRYLGPYIGCENDQYKLIKDIDIANYVDDAQNESINCSNFKGKKSLQKVKKELSLLDISCPVNKEIFEDMAEKYGYYAKFILNFDGMNKTEKIYHFREKTNTLKGWRKVPKELVEMIQNNYFNLEYKLNSKHITKFRYQKSDRKNSSIKTFIGNNEEIKLKENLSEKQKKCWYYFVSGGDCNNIENLDPLPSSYTKDGELDLLYHIRDISRRAGFAKAREVLIEELNKRPGNEIKNKIIETTLDENKIFEDSLANIPVEERKDIMFYFVLGLSDSKSKTKKKSTLHKVKL